MSIKDPIKKNKLQVFTTSPQKQKSQVTTMKENSYLFSRLCIACQSREGNLEDFFKHENQPWPPALRWDTEIWKQGRLTCKTWSFGATSGRKPTSYCTDTGWCCDSPNVVSKKLSNIWRLFQTMFMPYIDQQLEHADRIDIVWDVYTQGSMKAATRESRG